jgi:hypothetical protein
MGHTPAAMARTAARAAYAAAVCNALAPLAMLALLRPGLPVPGSTPEQRLAYVVEHRVLWSLGWLAWHAAALTLLAFYLALALRWRRDAPLRCGLALLCATAGLAVDLGAQAVAMVVMPELGADGFEAVEAAVGVLTGFLGNALYTLAGALLVWAGLRELPRGLVLLSLPVWTAGSALAAASLAQSGAGQVAGVAALFPLLVLWCLGVGRWLTGRAS